MALRGQIIFTKPGDLRPGKLRPYSVALVLAVALSACSPSQPLTNPAVTPHLAAAAVSKPISAAEKPVVTDLGHAGGPSLAVRIDASQYALQAVVHRWALADVDHYKVTLSSNGTTLVTVDVPKTGSPLAAFTGLAPNTTYRVKVEAYGSYAGAANTAAVQPMNVNDTANFADYAFNESNHDIEDTVAKTVKVKFDDTPFSGNAKVDVTASEGAFVPKTTPSFVNPAAGALGNFSTLSSTMTAARFYFSAATDGKTIYAGPGESGNYTTFERAPINGDGTLGAFGPTASTTIPHLYGSSFVRNGFVYVVGGYGGGGAIAGIERAPINADGSLGAFQVVGNLAIPRWSMATTVAGTSIYVLGGSSGNGFLAEIERIPFNADGTLGAAQVVGLLSSKRLGPVCASQGTKIYVAGGRDANNVELTTTDVLSVAADGSLAAVAAGPNLATPGLYGGAAVLGGSFYVVGGYHFTGNSRSLARVERATINGDGSLGAFSAAPSLSQGRYGLAVVAAGNSLYTLGGYTEIGATTTVERAALQ